jgi:hypothetical protein
VTPVGREHRDTLIASLVWDSGGTN